ncbi:MAG: gamma-glutamyl-phosphate reductase, partial [Longimicrobiales bacterium]
MQLAELSTVKKNKALKTLANLLDHYQDDVVEANKKDLENAEKKGLPRAHVNRLIFDKSKIKSRIISLQKIAQLPDPVGKMEKMGVMENGITYGRMRVPIGVILMIYEARPHVTVNAGSFALKSGNAIILKGGSEAENCL